MYKTAKELINAVDQNLLAGQHAWAKNQLEKLKKEQKIVARIIYKLSDDMDETLILHYLDAEEFKEEKSWLADKNLEAYTLDTCEDTHDFEYSEGILGLYNSITDYLVDNLGRTEFLLEEIEDE